MAKKPTSTMGQQTILEEAPTSPNEPHYRTYDRVRDIRGISPDALRESREHRERMKPGQFISTWIRTQDPHRAVLLQVINLRQMINHLQERTYEGDSQDDQNRRTAAINAMREALQHFFAEIAELERIHDPVPEPGKHVIAVCIEDDD